MTILIVDGSAQIIERWQLLFSESKKITQTYGAVAYKDASKLFKEKNPDVVLVDIDIPQINAVKLINEIKKSDAQKIVIALSIRLESHSKEYCNLLDADYYFDKYHEFEKIPAIINSLTFNEI